MLAVFSTAVVQKSLWHSAHVEASCGTCLLICSVEHQFMQPPSRASDVPHLIPCRYFVFTKGAKKLLTSENDSWTDAKAAWIAAACAAAVFIFTAAVFMPLLKWCAQSHFTLG